MKEADITCNSAQVLVQGLLFPAERALVKNVPASRFRSYWHDARLAGVERVLAVIEH